MRSATILVATIVAATSACGGSSESGVDALPAVFETFDVAYRAVTDDLSTCLNEGLSVETRRACLEDILGPSVDEYDDALDAAADAVSTASLGADEACADALSTLDEDLSSARPGPRLMAEALRAGDFEGAGAYSDGWFDDIAKVTITRERAKRDCEVDVGMTT